MIDLYERIRTSVKEHAACHFTGRLDKCVLTWYRANAKLGLHSEAGSSGAVISMSLGDSGLFQYKNSWKKASVLKSVKLTSGDVLVFGGVARGIVHGVQGIELGSGPCADFEGRLNINLREK